MTIEKMVLGQAVKLADLRDLYEQAEQKEVGKGRNTETGRVYRESLDSLFVALDHPERIKYNLVLEVFLKFSNKEKKQLSSSLRAWLLSTNSTYNLDKVDNILYVSRKD